MDMMTQVLYGMVYGSMVQEYIYLKHDDDRSCFESFQRILKFKTHKKLRILIGKVIT